MNLNNQRLDDLVFRMKKLVRFQDLHAKDCERPRKANHMLDKNRSALQENVYLERSNISFPLLTFKNSGSGTL